MTERKIYGVEFIELGYVESAYPTRSEAIAAIIEEYFNDERMMRNVTTADIQADMLYLLRNGCIDDYAYINEITLWES